MQGGAVEAILREQQHGLTAIAAIGRRAVLCMPYFRPHEAADAPFKVRV
jgi:hypothetical protein